MKFLRLILLVCLPLGVYSQEFQLQNISDEKDFPQIKLKLNLRDPNPKSLVDFVIKENETRVNFTLEEVKNNKSSSENNNVLVLIENLNQKDREAFYKTVLKNALSQIDLSHYKINIAVFDRVREKGTKTIFTVLPEYTNDQKKILQALEEIKPKDDIFGNNKSTDLYHALYEASQNINNSFSDNKNIILLSTAFNNKWSSHTSTESVKAYAKANDIAIYSIQYRIQGYEHHRLSDVVTSTYGSEIVSNNIKKATQTLSHIIKNIPTNYGKEYLLSYMSTHKQDGKIHTTSISVDQTEKQLTVKTKNKYVKLYYTLALTILLLLTGLIFFFIKKKNVKRKEQIDLLENKIQDESEKNVQLQHNISEQKNELNQIKDKETHKEKAAEEKRNEKALFEQMKKLGNLPEIQFFQTNELGEKMLQSYIIKKSQTLIGRKSNNDITLTEPSVSRLHALLYFKNDTYFIKNLSNTVGTKINKTQITEKELKHGNIIQLGKIELTFIQ